MQQISARGVFAPRHAPFAALGDRKFSCRFEDRATLTTALRHWVALLATTRTELDYFGVSLLTVDIPCAFSPPQLGQHLRPLYPVELFGARKTLDWHGRPIGPTAAQEHCRTVSGLCVAPGGSKGHVPNPARAA